MQPSAVAVRWPCDFRSSTNPRKNTANKRENWVATRTAMICAPWTPRKRPCRNCGISVPKVNSERRMPWEGTFLQKHGSTCATYGRRCTNTRSYLRTLVLNPRLLLDCCMERRTLYSSACGRTTQNFSQPISRI
eukprot:PhF_6_TR3694/c0_g1_i2/m.5261